MRDNVAKKKSEGWDEIAGFRGQQIEVDQKGHPWKVVGKTRDDGQLTGGSNITKKDGGHRVEIGNLLKLRES